MKMKHRKDGNHVKSGKVGGNDRYKRSKPAQNRSMRPIGRQ